MVCISLQGMFDIISLSGALIYTKAGGTVSRTGGLGICLSGVDGRIVGGGVEGPLMAAGPVQVLDLHYIAILTILSFEEFNPAIKQVIAGSFLIDINTDLSAPTKADYCTNELSTEAAASATLPSPVSMESTLGYKRRMTTSRESEDYQSMGGGYHLFHSRPIFPSPDWDGMFFQSCFFLKYIMLPLCTRHSSLTTHRHQNRRLQPVLLDEGVRKYCHHAQN